MTILRINERTKKGKYLLELLKRADDNGYISIEKIENWKSTRTIYEAKHGKAIIIKDNDSAIKILEELIDQTKKETPKS